MGNHRATRRRSGDVAGTSARADASSASSQTVTQTTSRTSAGKRRAVKHAAPRGSFLRKMPSAPILLGVAALAVSSFGAISMGDDLIDDDGHRLVQANALTGTSVVSSSSAAEERRLAVSRDSRRDALEDASAEQLQQAAEAQAQQRNAELAKLAKSAEKQAAKLKLNAWHLPVADIAYHLTAGFGESSGLWAHTHTGLDFAADTGTPIMSVTNGTVTEVGYDGSYGNKVVITTDEGEEFWYCHMNEFGASVGDVVRGGQVIGYVGSTGNVTGPHLHLEYRPGAGDPVDPYDALIAHGLNP
ncbi:M23 family metallopeptidase [Nocardioides guangzhouensis]|uniref:M23 family metallopeptidase n=1 Tax=Nocardioides guangzhouensis TaxID=2497878 RepID=A0A4Q4Z5P8_9ACTN|nr:M23 family metallopeptidase [Nocardioides guangzhouensis]RYP82768.1 M23 family metallopeptidase [Nocardioides guangzhouensis]